MFGQGLPRLHISGNSNRCLQLNCRNLQLVQPSEMHYNLEFFLLYVLVILVDSIYLQVIVFSFKQEFINCSGP